MKFFQKQNNYIYTIKLDHPVPRGVVDQIENIAKLNNIKVISTVDTIASKHIIDFYGQPCDYEKFKKAFNSVCERIF